MRAIKEYEEATIFLKEGGYDDGCLVQVFGSFVVYINRDGNEKVRPLHQVKEVAVYKGDEQYYIK